MTESERTPDGFRASRGHARPATPSPSPLTASPTHPTADVNGVGVGLVEELCARGVVAANARTLIQQHPAERIEQAIAYFDGLPDAGPGLLVKAIREGRAPQRRRSMAEEQAAYGRSVQEWLARNFPDLDRPRFGPHPAAVAAVFRLHQKHGKGGLSVREHGREIRAAVAEFEERFA